MPDEFTYGDDQFVDAFVELLVHLTHLPIRFLQLFGHPVEAFARLPGKIGDQLLASDLILRKNLEHLLQRVNALLDGLLFYTTVLRGFGDLNGFRRFAR